MARFDGSVRTDINIRNMKDLNDNSADIYLPILLKDSANLFKNEGNYILDHHRDRIRSGFLM